jgi:predicted DNA-binding protein with PD1-like motif
MDIQCDGDHVFLRVDAGELIVESLVRAVDRLRVPAAAITSGVGMVDMVTLGFFRTDRDEYDRVELCGVRDVSVLTGNVIRQAGRAVPHVHAVLNDHAHATFSGHLIEGRCHLTAEIFLVDTGLPVQRVKIPGRPATRIVAGNRP